MRLLTTFFSNDDLLRPEVYCVDEHTFVVLKYDEEGNDASRVYVDRLQEAENIAEDFVMRE